MNHIEGKGPPLPLFLVVWTFRMGLDVLNEVWTLKVCNKSKYVPEFPVEGGRHSTMEVIPPCEVSLPLQVPPSLDLVPTLKEHNPNPIVAMESRSIPTPLGPPPK